MNDFMKIFRDIHKYIHRDSRQRCSIEKLILEILQNSQENSCARVSLLKKRLRPATLSKKKLSTRMPDTSDTSATLATRVRHE